MSAGTPGTRMRGGPLAALVILLVGWVGARAALWDYEALTPSRFTQASLVVEGKGADYSQRNGADTQQPARGSQTRTPEKAAPAPGASRDEAPLWPDGERYQPFPNERQAPHPHPASPQPLAGSTATGSQAAPVAVHVAAGHQMLWMAALAKLPMPMAFMSASRAQSRSVPAPFYPVGREPVSRKRWSGDGWLMVRRGGGTALATGAAPATYGASQLGAVARYNLAINSRHRPKAYVRATAALASVRGVAKDKEVALGVSARLIPSVPVVAAAELRVTDQQGGTDARPAAMVVSELPRFDLPLGTRGEAYAQAGYVGGNFKTAFADGQLRVDRKVGQFGKSELRAGTGAWAGAQKGASRVDIGPTASVGVPVGRESAARLGVDWRFRVSGNARPRSGPAITLSAGF